VGNGGTQLFIRALDALEPVAVFTGEPSRPFVSPDGQWIGFFDGNSLKKVAITGGPTQSLGVVASSNLSRGATWGPNDTVILGSEHVTTGLQLLGAPGAPTTVLTSPDRARGELFHVWPELLPGGTEVLVQGGSNAHYVPSGHLIYTVADTLRAVAFDVNRLETRGPSVMVVPQVAPTATGGSLAVVARDGTLAYATGIGRVGNNSPRTLVWVDRQGRETLIL
jgi:serine/threonine-protein kinase